MNKGYGMYRRPGIKQSTWLKLREIMIKIGATSINEVVEFLLEKANLNPDLKEDEYYIKLKHATIKRLDNYRFSGDYNDLINKIMEKALKTIEIERENEKLKKEIQRLKRKLKENNEPYIHPMGYYG
jgi:predicted ribosome quality control (RQC) complex YloA/Tae2 family protein